MNPSSIIKSLRKGELTKDEANRLMGKIMNPKLTKASPSETMLSQIRVMERLNG